AVLVLLCAVAVYVLSGKDGGRFWQWSRVLPTNLVTRAALGRNPTLATGALVMLNVLTGAAAWWSFRQSLVNEPRVGSRRRMDSILFRLPGAAGGLAVKDVRYFRRLFDPYFGLLAAVLCCFYLVSSSAPS